MLLLVVPALLTALLVPPLIYYAWMKSKAKKNWGLMINNNYQPKVSLIIPTYNEASVISKKLENIQRIDYPEDRLQVIIVDSASTDGTLAVCKGFLEKNTLRFPIRLISERERLGKSHALNIASEYAEGEIIATSDADSFWEPDTLRKTIPFFADPSVGAVMGREELINLKQTIHTLSEGLYRKFFYTLRLGESKVHSTLFFQGELSLYRRSALEKFEDRAGYSDDIGTVVNIVSRGYRCIFIPEAVFYDTAAYSLRGRLMLKSRRAQHLISGVMESLKLKSQGRLPLSSAIVLFNFYMHVISPLLLVSVLVSTALTIVLNFQTFYYLIPLAVLLLIFKKSRVFMVSYLISNLALIIGLIRNFTGKKEMAWRKIEEMRVT
jgi:cellulose synthase/poly-beta-1,6-N-acetylglucosamine synthase-like glycosyltransferase